jgi:hypothetical protein
MTWIVVPNWDRFQHYGLYRRPSWIKNYTALLRKDEYLDQPLAARGLLHGIWLAYADRDGRLRKDDLPATLLARTRCAHITSLSQAGLIDFSASRPLPLSLIEEQGVPVEKSGDVPPTDLRVAAASKSERLHEQLLHDARQIADTWNGEGSDRFDDRIDMLESEFRSKLTYLERHNLWDIALGRGSHPS